MIQVPSTSLDELEDVFMAFENEVEGALTLVMGRVMRDGAVDRPPEKMSVDDLNVITPIWAKEVDRLLAVIKERYVGAANDQRARILDALNVNDLASSPVGKREPSSLVAAAPSSMDEFSGENASAVSYLQDARNRLVGVGDDLWSTARGELVTAMQQGESIPQMAKRVRDSSSLAAPRARTIARTEVVGASNAGSLAFMQQTGVASKKEWLATEDSRTRETHRAADGQKVAIDAKFNVGGALLDHPGDSYGPAREVVNCRCTMIYEVDDDALSQADAASEDQSDDTGLLPSTGANVIAPTDEEITTARERLLDPDELAFYKRSAERTGDLTNLNARLAKAQYESLRGEFETNVRPESREVLERAYFGNDDSFEINQALRNDVPPTPEISELRAASREWVTPEPVVVHRGLWDMGALPDDMTGAIWKDKAFQSTTFERTRAMTWAQSRGDNTVMMDITVPKGTRAAIGSSQDELLIPDGATLRIVSDTTEEYAGRRVRVLKCIVEDV